MNTLENALEPVTAAPENLCTTAVYDIDVIKEQQLVHDRQKMQHFICRFAALQATRTQPRHPILHAKAAVLVYVQKVRRPNTVGCC